MNKFHLCRHPLIEFLLSATLVVGIITNVKADTQYGPLKAGESLSGIVNQKYLSSPYDKAVIMQEILRVNPQAFINNNMGLIRRGVMLTLPSDATIRRSRLRQPNTASTVNLVTRRPRAIVQTLESTITQIRSERDQANQRAKRIETESVVRIESLSASVERLKTEKETISQELSMAQAQFLQLKRSLEKLAEENNQLIANKALKEKLTTQMQTDVTEQLETQITQLTDKNAELIRQLADTKSSLEALISSKTANGEQETVVESVITAPIVSDDTNTLLSEPITKKIIVEHLEKPVEFPLWGVMLGALALGFTSLMMLSRRREQVLPVAVPELVEQSEQVTLGEEGRVSHAFDPSVQDSDRETLRIQPRIDPSHVAIVDPTMTITPTMVAATAVPSESSGQPEEALAMSRPPSEYDEFESKFKLLIAETYKELDDTAAAYELLLEVQVEGSPQQGEVASSMIELLDR